MSKIIRKTGFFGKKHQFSEKTKLETDNVVIEGYTTVFSIWKSLQV